MPDSNSEANVPGGGAVGVGRDVVGSVIQTNVNQEFIGPTIFAQGPTVINQGQPSPPFFPPSRLVGIRFPPLREKFAGRQQLLEELAAKLQPGRVAALSQRAALQADGGVGKTALAIELGWRLYEEGKFAYVFLLGASTSESLQNDLAGLSARDQLNLPEQAAKEQSSQVAGVLAWLKVPDNAARTLLILDGADSPEACAEVRRLHPQLPGCAFLVTSRAHVGGGIPSSDLSLFSPAEAEDFLRSHLHPTHLQQSGIDMILDGIAEAVDHLPLALEIVASYIGRHQSPQEWLSEWKTSPGPTIWHHDPSEISYPKSLARVWEQTFARLSQMAQAHIFALAFMAPRPAGFPMSSLRQQERWREISQWFGELEKAALIQWLPGNDPGLHDPRQKTDEVSIHRILQTVIRDQLSPESSAAARSLALTISNASIPSVEFDIEGWRLWEQLLPHLKELLTRLRDTPEEIEAIPLMTEMGEWSLRRALYGESELLIRRALKLEEEIHGAERPKVVVNLNNLAQLLQATNRMAEAEPLIRQALTIEEKLYGSEHPMVAIRLNNLALLLHATNRLEEGEPLMRRGLAILEKSHDGEHPQLAITLNNLAEWLQDANRLEEAEPMMWRALAIVKKSHGDEHPEVANRLDSLAQLLQATNRLTEAESMMRQALRIDIKCYGGEHPEVATRLNNLAQLLQATDRLGEAEPLLRQALAIDKKSFGEEHPNVAVGLNNLAQLLQKTNRLIEAEPMMRRALAIDEKSYGGEHPNVARALGNLAQLLQETNRLEEAEPLMRRALEIDEKSYGGQHPNVAIRLDNLATLLQATNRLMEAEPLMRRALSIDEANYGTEHPEVAIKLNNLASLLQATNRLGEAEPLVRRALEIDEKSYGGEHPNVARDLNNLAFMLRAMNRLEEAETFSRRSVEIFQYFTFLTGYEHPHLRGSLGNYSRMLRELGWTGEAISARISQLVQECRSRVASESSSPDSEAP